MRTKTANTLLMLGGLAGVAGCEIQILPMPAGVLRVNECVECYDTVSREVWVAEPTYWSYYPGAVYEETTVEEYWYDDVVVEESYGEYYEEEYVAGDWEVYDDGYYYDEFDDYGDWYYFEDDWDDEYWYD